LVRYYAVALGPRGIRVNGVSPGTVVKRENQEFYARSEALVGVFKRTIPLGRMGTAVDVANVIAFLCGPQASFVTGQQIVVDGGVSLLSQESLARKIAGV
jgi:NAD(P)-dependent dehydrogenase (short-subunit alcohol dehydrogenase family)